MDILLIGANGQRTVRSRCGPGAYFGALLGAVMSYSNMHAERLFQASGIILDIQAAQCTFMVHDYLVISPKTVHGRRHSPYCASCNQALVVRDMHQTYHRSITKMAIKMMYFVCSRALSLSDCLVTQLHTAYFCSSCPLAILDIPELLATK